MDLSIVIVNWNTIDMLRDCLQSCYRNLERLDAEVVVIDNASSDGSADMVESEFPDAVLIRNSENRGFAAANNQGFTRSRGRHILLLNSDTVVHGDVLKETVQYLDAHPDIGVLACRVLNQDGTMQPNTSQFPSLLNLIILSSGLWRFKSVPFFDRYRMLNWDRLDARDVDVVAGCYMAVRKSAMDEVGVLDEDFYFFGEETDWCVRFREKGWRVHCAPVGEITHLGGGSARKLNFKRDVMLTNATIKLHHKHHGIVSATIAWILLLLFNGSRFLFWKVYGLLTRKEAAQHRADHFRKVVAEMPRCI
ncbi:GT2 family glycosyltransferase [Labrenzia sp. EL_159]|uniref:glycosyltransferase family 2 protein n=1 Tax=Roseibium album TaxID=311410 RepID=UPI0018C9F02A|nr:glycosyltransferase family 2 protein [Roseibium album]MBG6158977.1 GT2 family glycosyltransferase [Labrenzia sp. EL_162]MBG6160805.1 GT2 family glycosyltransferase [Labrenzia sp. EL_195]MBG6197511.1 GT2 family glycosyltransferase [Labrenzia sp. EL_159]